MQITQTQLLQWRSKYSAFESIVRGDSRYKKLKILGHLHNIFLKKNNHYQPECERSRVCKEIINLLHW